MTEQSKFRVGDVVRVTSLPGPKWSMEVGETFKIDQLDERGAHKNVVCGTYFIPLAHIELVSALEPASTGKTDAECRSCDARPGLLSAEGLCNDCHIAAAHKAEAKGVDRYAQLRKELMVKLTNNAAYGDQHLDRLVADRTDAMTKAQDARVRNVAALRADLDRKLPKKPSRHDARPIDIEQAWSTPGWES